MAAELVSVERRYLARLGHGTQAVVHIGHEGIAPNVVESAEVALEARELIKVKINPNYEGDRHETARTLGEQTGSHLVQVVGRTFLLYRRNETKPKIVFPPEVKTRAARRRRRDRQVARDDMES